MQTLGLPLAPTYPGVDLLPHCAGSWFSCIQRGLHSASIDSEARINRNLPGLPALPAGEADHQEVKPASARITWPVIELDASDPKKAITRAISSGSISLCCGTWLSHCSIISGDLLPTD